MKPRIIAFYLPQFHPFKENNEWWGEGFTEWNNVTQAQSLFKGHYQPRFPSTLGYYDLRVAEIREQQAVLAKEAGIEGFCYWHYWFEGQELMERPFWEMVNSGNPDFPFCIGWANESWKSKMWRKDGTLDVGTKLLIEQTYSNKDDVEHFYRLLRVFKDPRYIKVSGAPLVFIHRATDLPESTIETWTKLATENGLPGIHFVGRIPSEEETLSTKVLLLKRGFSAVTIGHLGESFSKQSIGKKIVRKISALFRYNGCMRVISYKEEMKSLVNVEIDSAEDVYPCIYPNWDHSPRSGRNAFIIHGSTPQLFKNHAKQVFRLLKNKTEEHQIVFLKSWNEWGEGNYMEPDQRFGKAYIYALKEALSDVSSE